MATTVARLQAILSADTRDFDRAMGRSETKTQRFGKVAKAALIGGAAAGFYGLVKAAKIGWDEYNKGQAVAAQTNAVIKSTGGIANVTAEHVEDLGERLMRLSGIDDEVIKSGENVLLTFRGIRNEVGKGNDIFDQATKLTLDLSVAMHKDLNSSALVVGKALQDPIRGLTALRRVGVQFTVAQEEAIKKMVQTGNVAGAQKLILAELRKEFGGSARAAGQTFGGQINIARERLNNFLGTVVERAIPYAQRFAVWLNKDGGSARKFARDLGTLINAIIQLISWANAAISTLNRLFDAFRRLGQATGGGLLQQLGIRLPSGSLLGKLQRQHGGPVIPGGIYRVGEAGEETLVMGRTGGYVIPHAATRLAAAAGGGATTVYNFNGAILDGEKLLAFIRNQNARFERNNGRPAF